MALPPAHDRKPAHHRQIDCRGYRRSDGLWDIEGHLVDTRDESNADAFDSRAGHPCPTRAGCFSTAC